MDNLTLALIDNVMSSLYIMWLLILDGRGLEGLRQVWHNSS